MPTLLTATLPPECGPPWMSSEFLFSFPTDTEECYFPFIKIPFVYIAPGLVSFFTISQSTTVVYEAFFL